MLRLSEHFIANWRQRVGGRPSIELVRKIMAEGIKLQHCRDLTEADGSSYRILAWYWHPELAVVISVDHISETVVSVLSPACCRRSEGED